jgi:hypothetical protein
MLKSIALLVGLSTVVEASLIKYKPDGPNVSNTKKH